MNKWIRRSTSVVMLMVTTTLSLYGHATPFPHGRPGGLKEGFGLSDAQQTKSYVAHQIACTSAGNVLWPGEAPEWTVQFQNKTDQPINATGRVEVMSYRTMIIGRDVFATIGEKLADIGQVPIQVQIPASGYQDVKVKPVIPETFGAYVMVVELEGQGRDWVSSFVRTPKADGGRVQFPAFAMDFPSWMATKDGASLFQRVGIKGARTELGYTQTFDPNYERIQAGQDAYMKTLKDHDITLLNTAHGGPAGGPLNLIRSFLNDKGEGPMAYPGDFTWEPKWDDDYQKWVTEFVGRYGWPNGPMNAIELWNEPWEGISISGWGADIPRYRELYTRMGQGVEDARKKYNVDVLVGGTCSSMNTEDKLFPDGKNTYLKWLDFTSIHYQPMAAWPALVPGWVNRKSPHGPVRVWDTESWLANTEDRVAGVLASMRAQGQERTAGVFHDMVYTLSEFEMLTPEGKKPTSTVHAWAPAAAVAASQKYMGQRPFKELLFKNGLPWVFVFEGLDGKVDDSSVVVLGDLGAIYEPERNLFWGVKGIATRKKIEALRTQLAATEKEEERKKLRETIYNLVLEQASMTLNNPNDSFTLYDFYGNPQPSKGGKLSVPLNGLGYFLRADGSPGSFNRLLEAIKASRVDGYEPVEIVAKDLTAPVAKPSANAKSKAAAPVLRLAVTNILNRAVQGKLDVRLGKLKLQTPQQTISLAVNETKNLSIPVIGGTPDEGNIYPLNVVFDAGEAGATNYDEELHVNLIAKRAINVDGKLDDWKSVLPQPMKSEGGSAGLTEQAWFPFLKFDEKAGGVAAAYLAYDAKNFYYAAKIADNTPYDGNVRFETRDDDSYFYPETSYRILEKDAQGNTTKREELKWPEGVRRFSYRKNPDVPSGDGTDNIQIAFNAIPLGQDGVLPNPPGTMPRFMAYKCSDYEYAFNQVATKFGGGTEIWRLLAPGVPRKHYFPRQPKAPIDGGPVKAGKLSMRRDGNTRIVEASIPWTELPDVKKLLDAGKTVKFTCRVNNNGGAPIELAAKRSVSKINIYSLHDYWAGSWANEVEFSWEQ